MTKNEDDKNRIWFRKQNSGAYNRKVKQKRDELTKSLVVSMSNLYKAKIKKSQPSTFMLVEQLGDENHVINENIETHEALISENKSK